MLRLRLFDHIADVNEDIRRASPTKSTRPAPCHPDAHGGPALRAIHNEALLVVQPTEDEPCRRAAYFHPWYKPRQIAEVNADLRTKKLTRLHQLRGLGDTKVLKSLGRSPKGRH